MDLHDQVQGMKQDIKGLHNSMIGFMEHIDRINKRLDVLEDNPRHKLSQAKLEILELKKEVKELTDSCYEWEDKCSRYDD